MYRLFTQPVGGHFDGSNQGNAMEKCYEYFNCTETECPVHGKSDLRCWEIEETECHYPPIETLQHILSGSGRNKCDLCIYYKTVK